MIKQITRVNNGTMDVIPDFLREVCKLGDVAIDRFLSKFKEGVYDGFYDDTRADAMWFTAYDKEIHQFEADDGWRHDITITRMEIRHPVNTTYLLVSKQPGSITYTFDDNIPEVIEFFKRFL